MIPVLIAWKYNVRIKTTKRSPWNSLVAPWVKNPALSLLWHRFDPWPHSAGQRLNVAVSCGVGCRCGSDPALLWLWRRRVATAPIQPLAWEPPYAVGAAQEIAKRPKKKKTNLLKTSVRTTWNICQTKTKPWGPEKLRGTSKSHCQLWQDKTGAQAGSITSD